MKNVHEIEIKLDKEWIDALDATFKKKNKEVKIDGFRKGMASKDIYLKHFGIESLYADAVDTCIGVAYKKALEDNKLVPACEPSVDVTGISDSNVIFKFKIITKPEVTLGEYKNLKIKKEKVKVTDEEIDNQIEHMRSHMADIVVKDNGEIVNGDTAVINFEGKVDGKVVDGATGENYPLEIGSHSFIPGFEEGLVGLKKGDVKELNLKFPENYVEDLKGKDVVFTVTVNEIKTKVLPEINEDFFKDLGYEDVKTLDELKNKVKEELTHEKEHQEEEKFMDQVLETAVKNMKIELNEEIVDEEIHRMINQYAEQLKMYGMDINEYFKMTGMNEETLHTQMQPEAEKRVKYRYLLEAVAEKEDIKFTEKEIEKGAENLATKYGITKEQLIESFGSMDVVEYDMKMQKAIEILKENN
ncbi:trigger factor [bacterium]|nr:trigger factor [bacterium]